MLASEEFRIRGRQRCGGAQRRAVTRRTRWQQQQQQQRATADSDVTTEDAVQQQQRPPPRDKDSVDGSRHRTSDSATTRAGAAEGAASGGGENDGSRRSNSASSAATTRATTAGTSSRRRRQQQQHAVSTAAMLYRAQTFAPQHRLALRHTSSDSDRDSHHTAPPAHDVNNNNNSKHSHSRGDVLRVARLACEDDEGDVEYKWRLTAVTSDRLEHLMTQMQFRVLEGSGQCLYELGVSDDGVPRGLSRDAFDESVATLRVMARRLGFDARVLHQYVVCDARHDGDDHADDGDDHADGDGDATTLWCGEVMVSRRHAASQDVSVAFCGDVGSGKSTLIGVLLTSTLDDGAGGLRQALFNHKHEITSGRTTSIATRVWSVTCDDATTAATATATTTTTGTRGDVDATRAPSPAPREYALWATAMTPDTLTDAMRARSGGDDGDDDAAAAWAMAQSPSDDDDDGEAHATWPVHAAAAAATTTAASAVTATNDDDDDNNNNNSGSTPTLASARAPGRLIRLTDLGGNICKSMLFGLMSRPPDYVCVCVAATSACEQRVLLYAQVCRAMCMPFLVVVTMCDRVADFELDGVLMELSAVLRRAGCACDVMTATASENSSDGGGNNSSSSHRRRTQQQQQQQQQQLLHRYTHEWLPRHRQLPPLRAVDVAATATTPSALLRVPVFCVSSVTGGDGLDAFRRCVAQLRRCRRRRCRRSGGDEDDELRVAQHDDNNNTDSAYNDNDDDDSSISDDDDSACDAFEVLLDHDIVVRGVGHVVYGRVARGVVALGCSGVIGPDGRGVFHDVVVRGIHVDGVHVNEALADDEATFALDRLPREVELAHKGKVLLSRRRLLRPSPQRLHASSSSSSSPPLSSTTGVCRGCTLVVRVLSQTMTEHLQPMLYTRNTRQAVRLLSCRRLDAQQHDDDDDDKPRELATHARAAVPGATTTTTTTRQPSPTMAAHDTDGELQLQCAFLFRPEALRVGALVVLHWHPSGVAVGRIVALDAAAIVDARDDGATTTTSADASAAAAALVDTS